jgi:hypothetical protein
MDELYLLLALIGDKVVLQRRVVNDRADPKTLVRCLQLGIAHMRRVARRVVSLIRAFDNTVCWIEMASPFQAPLSRLNGI